MGLELRPDIEITKMIVSPVNSTWAFRKGTT